MEKKQIKEEKLHENSIFEIENIGLSIRACNCLKRAGIKTTKDLLEKIEKPEDLYKIRDLGRETYKEILEKVHSLGLKFKDEERKEKLHQNSIFEIEDIGLSIRTCNCLKRAGIKTTKDLLEKIERPGDLYKIRDLGRETYKEILDKAHSLGIKFKYEKEEERRETATIELEQEGNVEESKSEEKSDMLSDSFSETVQKISDFNNKYTDICEKNKYLKEQKGNITQEIETFLEQWNKNDDIRIPVEIEIFMLKICKTLQEQTELLKDIDMSITEIRKLEEINREERIKMTEKFPGMIQGGK